MLEPAHEHSTKAESVTIYVYVRKRKKRNVRQPPIDGTKSMNENGWSTTTDPQSIFRLMEGAFNV